MEKVNLTGGNYGGQEVDLSNFLESEFEKNIFEFKIEDEHGTWIYRLASNKQIAIFIKLIEN